MIIIIWLYSAALKVWQQHVLHPLDYDPNLADWNFIPKNSSWPII